MIRFPLGILSDILHQLRKQLYVAGFFIGLLSCIMLVYFDSFSMVLIARLLAGITASMWVMATILYAQYFTASGSTKAMGTIQFLTVLPQFISMIIAGYLVEKYGWLFPFWVGAAASLLGLILACFIKVIPIERSKRKVKRTFIDYVKETCKVPRLIVITLLALLGHAVIFITIFGFTPLYAVSHGVKESQLIWLFCAFFIPHAAASLGSPLPI